jgi:hypothetical protein
VRSVVPHLPLPHGVDQPARALQGKTRGRNADRVRAPTAVAEQAVDVRAESLDTGDEGRAVRRTDWNCWRCNSVSRISPRRGRRVAHRLGQGDAGEDEDE